MCKTSVSDRQHFAAVSWWNRFSPPALLDLGQVNVNFAGLGDSGVTWLSRELQQPAANSVAEAAAGVSRGGIAPVDDGTSAAVSCRQSRPASLKTKAGRSANGNHKPQISPVLTASALAQSNSERMLDSARLDDEQDRQIKTGRDATPSSARPIITPVRIQPLRHIPLPLSMQFSARTQTCPSSPGKQPTPLEEAQQESKEEPAAFEEEADTQQAMDR